MNENPDATTTQAAMDEALNPDTFSGAEMRALKALDAKNLDTADLASMLQQALAAYQRGKTDGVANA